MPKKSPNEIDGVVLSLHEKYWRAMLKGEKNLEVRKSMPSDFQELVSRDGFMRCYVYVTGPRGKVRGFFDCTKIIYSDKPKDILCTGKTFLTAKEIHDYGTGRNGFLYAWSVENVRKYDKPLSLDVFGMSKPPLSWGYCYL